MADRPLKEVTETIRIPLYSTEEQRLSSAKNGGIGTYQYGGFEQQLVNCFPVIGKDPLSPDTPSVRIVNRVGFSTVEYEADTTGKVNDPDRCAPLAALSFSSLVDVLVTAHYDYSDNKLYILQHRPAASTIVQIKVIDTSIAPWVGIVPQVFLTELSINNVPYLGVVLSGSAIGGPSSGWYAASASGVFAAGSLTEITDGDFPPKQGTPRKITGPMVQMDGYTFVLTEDGYIYNSDLNSISVWNTAGYVGAISRPDRGVTLARYKHHIVAFGDSTVEFFNNEGIAAPNSPLKRTQQAFIAMGALGPKAVLNMDDTLYWLAKSSTGALGLWKLDGYEPTLVSQYYHSYLTQASAVEPNLQAITMYGTRHIITNILRTSTIGWIPQRKRYNVLTIAPSGTSAVITTTVNHTYNAGDYLYFNGFTGADAGYINNKRFTVSSANASSVTIPLDLTGKTITVGSGVIEDDITPDNALLYGTPVYCVDSNAWWMLAFEFSGFYGQIHVARSNPSTGGGLQATHIWCGVGSTNNVDDNYGLHPVILTDTYELNADTVSWDGFRDGNATSILYYRIPVAIFTNIYDFNNENRKFIKRVKLIGDKIYWLNPVGYEPYLSFKGEGLRFHFAYTKREVASQNPDAWSLRPIETINDTSYTYNDIQSRYYWNNLGAGREWKFGIFISTWVPIRFEALEVTVGQGTH